MHIDESAIATSSYKDLKEMADFISGGIDFKDQDIIEFQQIKVLAEAFINNKSQPIFIFNVDDALDGDRNNWIERIRVSSNINWSNFSETIQERRGKVSFHLNRYFQHWQVNKPSSKSILAYELETAKSWYNSPENIYAPFINQELIGILRRRGISKEDCDMKIKEFWEWEEIRMMPKNYIQAHLLAALARQAAYKLKLPTPGMWTDIQFISTYLPYCDAMFIDGECVEFLRTSKITASSSIYAQTSIFPCREKEKFLAYLKTLVSKTDLVFVEKANEIYRTSYDLL